MRNVKHGRILQGLFDEWGTLDRVLGRTKTKRERTDIAGRKARIGELIIKIRKSQDARRR